MIWLSEDDVRECRIAPGKLNVAIREAFVDSEGGLAVTDVPMSIGTSAHRTFRAKVGVLGTKGFTAIKWYGYYPGNLALGLPEYQPIIILNENEFGRLVAIMDAGAITAMRTGSIGALAAAKLADPASKVVAFVGCGALARAHLDALACEFTLKRALIVGRSPNGISDFGEYCVSKDLEYSIIQDPRDAVGVADIIVSSVPAHSNRTGFLKAEWVKPGGLAIMPDLGISWESPGALKTFDRCYTDDADQLTSHIESASRPDAIGRLASLLTSRSSGFNGRINTAFVFGGSGLADAAAAIVVYQAALERDIGAKLR